MAWLNTFHVKDRYYIFITKKFMISKSESINFYGIVTKKDVSFELYFLFLYLLN